MNRWAGALADASKSKCRIERLRIFGAAAQLHVRSHFREIWRREELGVPSLSTVAYELRLTGSSCRRLRLTLASARAAGGSFD